MSEYLVLQHVCSVSHFPASLPLRFQKLNIPCLHLEINHTIERILQCYVADSLVSSYLWGGASGNKRTLPH